MKILYINPLMLYPVTKGNQMTGLNRIKELSKSHDITLVAFYDDKEKIEESLLYLKSYCKEVVPIYLPKWKSIWNMIKGFFFSKLPFRILFYQSNKLKKNIKELNNYDIIHFNGLQTEQYANFTSIPFLIDLHDSHLLNIPSRLAKENGFKKIILKLELNRIKKYEIDVIKKYRFLMVLAEQDKLVHKNNEKIEVIHLGVNQEEFRRIKPLSANKTILFSGNMSYSPNIEAVIWFITNCWSKILDQVPDAKFVVVGADPSPRLDKYRKENSIEIIGRVASIEDVMNTVQLSIAPMQSGSGMQNKVLEAMACGLPVICSSLGLGNIEAEVDKNVIVVDSPEDFSNKCIMLLNNHELCVEIGVNATKLIHEKYSIKYHCQKLETLYKKIIEEHSNLPK